MRKNRQTGNETKRQRAERAGGWSGFARSALARRLGHHRVPLRAENPFARRVKECRRGERDGYQGEGERISSDVADTVKYLHRSDPSEVEHEGHAKLRKRPDEDDRSAREEAWRDERKSDLSEFPKAHTTQVFRSLLKRRIDVRQGCHNVQVEDRIKVESVHHDDSPEPAPSQPIDGVIRSQQPKRFQKGVECPLLAKYLFDSDRTDKRGKNHGDENQAGKQGFSRKDETVAEKGKGESKESRKNCARDGEKEGVRETLQVNRVPENLDDV